MTNVQEELSPEVWRDLDFEMQLEDKRSILKAGFEFQEGHNNPLNRRVTST